MLEHIGAIAGIAAIAIFVIVKSIFWYAIPPVIKKDEEDKPFVLRMRSKAHRITNNIALFLSFAGLGVTAYFNGFSDAFLFGSVFMLMMVIIYYQETTRLSESLKEHEMSLEEVLESK